MKPPIITEKSDTQLQTVLALDSLFEDPWHSRNMKKLKPSEIEIARNFLSEFGHLDRATFEFSLNRLFIDREKPKNWTTLLEVTSAAHFKIHGFPETKKKWRHPFDPE